MKKLNLSKDRSEALEKAKDDERFLRQRSHQMRIDGKV
jgi:hypothetical protein